MTSIAFFNNKGGVGKTTLLCNLAGFFSLELGKRVLVIDADAQSNATTYLLPATDLLDLYENESTDNLYEYYETVANGQGYAPSCPTIKYSSRFNVDLLPGHPKFALREDLLASDWSDTLAGKKRGLQTTYAFHHLIETVSPSYDLIFIDMGPSLGAINRSILLAADLFLTPMSVDLFSLMAIGNILSSLKIWRDELNSGLDAYARANSSRYMQGGKEIKWHVRFLGYVMQQYIMQTIRGEQRVVKSYDKIIKQFPAELNSLEGEFGYSDPDSANLGQFPSLFSLVPMSQSAHAPIFMLGSSDGVVGAHFAKVDESREMFANIAHRVLRRIEAHGVGND